MEAIKKFFEENPGASECFVALGYVKASIEEAEALVMGTGAKVQTVTREEAEAVPAEEVAAAAAVPAEEVAAAAEAVPAEEVAAAAAVPAEEVAAAE